MKPLWKLMLVGGMVAATACTSAEDVWVPEPGIQDTWVPPKENDCVSLLGTFDGEATGVYEGLLSGYAIYQYQSAPIGVTNVQMHYCDPKLGALGRVMNLAFYGADRVPVGTYKVDHQAVDNGGMSFGYSDATDESAGNCNFYPVGTVEISQSTFRSIEGSFEISARCLTEVEQERSTDSTFVGAFSATNSGVE